MSATIAVKYAHFRKLSRQSQLAIQCNRYKSMTYVGYFFLAKIFQNRHAQEGLKFAILAPIIITRYHCITQNG
jgi:hypothetical protein